MREGARGRGGERKESRGVRSPGGNEVAGQLRSSESWAAHMQACRATLPLQRAGSRSKRCPRDAVVLNTTRDPAPACPAPQCRAFQARPASPRPFQVRPIRRALLVHLAELGNRATRPIHDAKNLARDAPPTRRAAPAPLFRGLEDPHDGLPRALASRERRGDVHDLGRAPEGDDPQRGGDEGDGFVDKGERWAVGRAVAVGRRWGSNVSLTLV